MRYLCINLVVAAFLGRMVAQVGSFSLGLGIAPQRVTTSAGGFGVSEPGYAFGLLGRYAFKDRMALGLDLLYSITRTKETLNILGVRYEKVTISKSLKLPIQFVYMLSPMDKFYVDLFGGLQPEIDLGTTTKTTENGVTKTQTTAGDGLSLGLLLGVGGRYEISDKLSLAGQLRFDYKQKRGALSNVNITTLAFLVGAYYQLN